MIRIKLLEEGCHLVGSFFLTVGLFKEMCKWKQI